MASPLDDDGKPRSLSASSVGYTNDLQMASDITDRTVVVTSIPSDQTSASLTQFFSFCGGIESCNVTPDRETDGLYLRASIVFASKMAAQTAILLSPATLGRDGQAVTITSIDNTDGTYSDNSGGFGVSVGLPGSQKPGVFASALASTYLATQTAGKKIKTLSSKYHVTNAIKATGRSVKQGGQKIDRSLHVTAGVSKVKTAAQPAAAKASGAINTVTGKISRTAKTIGRKATNNSIVAGAVGAFQKATMAVDRKIAKLGHDTRQAVADKRAAKIRRQLASGEISVDPDAQSSATIRDAEYTAATGLLPGSFPSPPQNNPSSVGQGQSRLGSYTPPPVPASPGEGEVKREGESAAAAQPVTEPVVEQGGASEVADGSGAVEESAVKQPEPTAA